jgi:hypothetical protein
MSEGLANLHKSLTELRKMLTERYEYKPIPSWLGSMLSWILILSALTGIWFADKHWSDALVWVGLGLFIISGLGQFVLIMFTRR